MRIRSRFRDYYDYVAGLYGGGDPKIVYNRETIVDPFDKPDAKDIKTYPSTLEGIYLPKEMDHESLWLKRDSEPWRPQEGDLYNLYRGLAVAGKIYYLKQVKIAVRNELTCGIEFKVKEPWRVVEYTQDRGPSWIQTQTRRVSGTEVPKLMPIHRVLKAPVFMFLNHYHGGIEVLGRVPVLGDLGLPAFVPAEQLYQELSMFMSKLYSDNPDMMPKSPQTDVQKIEAHGFDKKKSFRHRK